MRVTTSPPLIEVAGTVLGLELFRGRTPQATPTLPWLNATVSRYRDSRRKLRQDRIELPEHSRLAEPRPDVTV